MLSLLPRRSSIAHVTPIRNVRSYPISIAYRRRLSRTAFMSEQQPEPKRQKMTTKIIGTHNGTFHCDEALAVFLLRQTNTFKEAGLKRSRDPAVLATCDIVVDVGAVYDETKLLFDHHQRGFTEVFGHGFQTKLSSAGLVYKHFGKEVIANRTQLAIDDPKVELLWLKMYRVGSLSPNPHPPRLPLLQPSLTPLPRNSSKPSTESTTASPNSPAPPPPLYRSRTDLSSRVGALNPWWNQAADPQSIDARFAQASLLTGTEFLGRLDYYAQAWLPARDLLVRAIKESREGVDGEGKIILFEQFLPWKEHLFELEAQGGEAGAGGAGVVVPGQAIYVIYPDETGGNWRIQAVPQSPESFESRKALPEAWRGLRDDELTKKTGVEGGIFVHASGFIGGNKTKAGALLLAQNALKM